MIENFIQIVLLSFNMKCWSEKCCSLLSHTLASFTDPLNRSSVIFGGVTREGHNTGSSLHHNVPGRGSRRRWRRKYRGREGGGRRGGVGGGGIKMRWREITILCWFLSHPPIAQCTSCWDESNRKHNVTQCILLRTRTRGPTVGWGFMKMQKQLHKNAGHKEHDLFFLLQAAHNHCTL